MLGRDLVQDVRFGLRTLGRRPGFTDAAAPEVAEQFFQRFVERVSFGGLKVATGRFQEHMQVEIHNDGPVTIMLDSRERHSPRNN